MFHISFENSKTGMLNTEKMKVSGYNFLGARVFLFFLEGNVS